MYFVVVGIINSWQHGSCCFVMLLIKRVRVSGLCSYDCDSFCCCGISLLKKIPFPSNPPILHGTTHYNYSTERPSCCWLLLSNSLLFPFIGISCTFHFPYQNSIPCHGCTENKLKLTVSMLLKANSTVVTTSHSMSWNKHLGQSIAI